MNDNLNTNASNQAESLAFLVMDDYLSNHLPEGAWVHHIEGAYAEIEYEGRDYGLHASGNGDSFNYVIRWELI